MTIKIDIDKDGEDDFEIHGTSPLGRCLIVFVYHVCPWLIGAGIGLSFVI